MADEVTAIICSPEQAVVLRRAGQVRLYVDPAQKETVYLTSREEDAWLEREALEGKKVRRAAFNADVDRVAQEYGCTRGDIKWAFRLWKAGALQDLSRWAESAEFARDN